MAENSLPSSMEHSDDEDYIEIEVSSFYSPKNRDFEFKMASITNNKESITSPADELFYRGKLLPLHQSILQKEPFQEEDLEETFCINLLITPIGSSNISPSQSCRVSFELNPNDHHFFELITSSSCIIHHNISPKKLWFKKLIKHSLITQKFKTSKTFLKSLFRKSSCCNKDMKVSKKTIPSRNSTKINKKIEGGGLFSRSFSEAEMKCLSSSSTNSSSSTTGASFSSSDCSFNSNNCFYELNFLKRSNSFFSSEIECSIEAAVAHCKKTHTGLRK